MQVAKIVETRDFMCKRDKITSLCVILANMNICTCGIMYKTTQPRYL